MKTDELIRALAANASRPVMPIDLLLLKALGIGALLSIALFLSMLHPRPDIGAAVATGPFVFKLFVMLAVTASATLLLPETARPLPPRYLLWSPLVLAPLLLAGGVVAELSTIPSQWWMPRLLGRNARHCVALIPLLSLPLLICLLSALRRGAPLHPGLAGASAGLVSGGLGALLYAFTCQDDSPLFIATWYSMAIAIVTAAAASIGRRTLRW